MLTPDPYADVAEDRDFDELSPAEDEKARQAMFEAWREIAHADFTYSVDDCAVCRAKVL